MLNLTEKSETEAPSTGAGGYGKEHGGDIAEGKRTLISIELLERLSAKDAERVRTILLQTREHVTHADIEWFISKAKNSGTLESVASICQEQATLASAALEILPVNPASSLLGELVEYLTIERKA